MDGTPNQVLAAHTTLRVGGPADRWIVAEAEDALIAAVVEADSQQTPVLLLGGGSNLLVADEGFRGTVVQITSRGVDILEATGDAVALRVAAGETWDDLVALTVSRGWGGIEALSGIPGCAGATPLQNVGAYGQDISQVITAVRAWDRDAGEVRELSAEQCTFGYRTSRFKGEADRWVILSVDLVLDPTGMGQVRYSELGRALGVAEGATAPVQAIRDAVLTLRAGKGMVLDDDDADTWSAGSFFTNPIVDEPVAARLPEACPRYPATNGVKLSAAWLIEQAGIARGFSLAEPARAAISSKHTLALTNRGDATAADLLDLARAVRGHVQDAFGITLEPEPTLVGCAL